MATADLSRDEWFEVMCETMATKQGGKHGYSFKWTDEEWAVLEPLPEAERFTLMVSAMFSGRGVIAEAAHQELLRGGGKVDTPGS